MTLSPRKQRQSGVNFGKNLNTIFFTSFYRSSERWKHLEDYSLGSLLRLDSSKDYSEENTCISVKIQFLAIEIARNRGGFNDDLRKNFKPTPRKSKQQQAAEDASTAEVEAELKQVLSGQHPLLS